MYSKTGKISFRPFLVNLNSLCSFEVVVAALGPKPALDAALGQKCPSLI